MRVDVALPIIRGEQWLFKSADQLIRNHAERHGHSISTTAADPLSQEAVAARGEGASPHSGIGSARLFTPFHTSEIPRGH